MALFFSNQMTNASSPPVDWFGGDGTFYAQGVFDGGTVSLQASFDGATTWIDVGPDASFTQAGAGNFRIGRCQLRAVVSGATSPDLTAGI